MDTTFHVLDLKSKECVSAFYGCFDWHSSVQGHWTLVTILSEFPDFKFKNEINFKKHLENELFLKYKK